jgi:hypothetical protein
MLTDSSTFANEKVLEELGDFGVAEGYDSQLGFLNKTWFDWISVYVFVSINTIRSVFGWHLWANCSRLLQPIFSDSFSWPPYTAPKPSSSC